MESLLASLAMLAVMLAIAFIAALIVFYFMNKMGMFKDEIDQEAKKPLLDSEDLISKTPKHRAAVVVSFMLTSKGFSIKECNIQKPWGAEIKIAESQARKFLETFFGKNDFPADVADQPVGPKILIIEEDKRLSWHFHERKDAFLKVLAGRVSVYMSIMNKEPEPVFESSGALVHIPELVRHRLGGLNGWAVVAEISRNVFVDRPSDDSDEKRISDDFGRV